MVGIVYSAALSGVDGIIVTVEAKSTSSQDPKLEIIGLPDAAVKEAAQRVFSAANSSSISFGSNIMTVNLAPAYIRKEGSAYDLPILLSCICALGSASFDLSEKCFLGELSLTGALRPVRGVLSMAIAARDNGFKEIYVPEENAPEAAAARGIKVYPVKNVSDLLMHLDGAKTLEECLFDEEAFRISSMSCEIDMSDVKGQSFAKYAMEIAAAGNHNILMIGPPGTGKSMLASRLSTILPPLTLNESIETTKVYSISGLIKPSQSLITLRPFRTPHHSVSAAGLAGGGRNPIPGEISLAHNGVLFLDELPEFDKNAMEILRQPLEEKRVSITRVNGKIEFPSAFMLVAAMNPCKCGFFGHPTKQCTCSLNSRRQYVSRVSGPLLDRIDIQVELRPLEYDTLTDSSESEKSADIFKRVMRARNFAAKRFENVFISGTPVTSNSMMNGTLVRKFCILDDKGSVVLKRAYETLGLSARGYDRILKIARTVADFDESEVITSNHVAMAIQLRTLDRNYWE